MGALQVFIRSIIKGRPIHTNTNNLSLRMGWLNIKTLYTGGQEKISTFSVLAPKSLRTKLLGVYEHPTAKTK